ncbi:MAG: ABC transporter ATP-binding protein/permease [Rudaea sp.]|uniref:ABC transporter ATP-binding protein/permease n=1 Tax=Rudaea sp. 3F27F6 TaxID=2502208 RepID=UPI0010F4DF96|nr:ABC transporter ATP-binding protein/permease [Rudaea sp. 3F27F6]MBR0347354.1 ABC transporter ATP-binding protein/permease [Rudaea sp.]
MSRRRVVFKLVSTLVHSPYRWRMLATLLLSLLILGIELWIGIQLASFLGRIVDTLTQRDAAGFRTALLGLSGSIASFFVCISAYVYFSSHLQMQARTALTYPWLRDWLDGEAVYRLEREQQIDNPDQRIAEDLKLFVTHSLGLLMGAANAFGGVFAYSTQLWSQGGELGFEFAGRIWTISGYLFWIALIYSIVDFVLTRRIAQPQIGLNMQQQHFEADFRFGMAQVREHAEQVALYRGAGTEFRRLTACFEKVRQNWWRLIAYQLGLNVYRSAISNVSTFLIFLLLGPRVLAGVLTVGAMTTLQSLYGQTLSKLNWFAVSWTDIVAWLAVVNRLAEFDRAVNATPRGGIEVDPPRGPVLMLRGLSLTLPNGTALSTIGDITIETGQRWLVRGPSGVGKSTLLRAIAGLWPHGRGRIQPPQARVLFLPQKSYLPWDTLKVALAYPHSAESLDDDACRLALEDCRLPRLVSRLHESDRWSMRLSLGEQQRMAFARALLHKPDFLFLDEATSALDLDTERHLYQLLCERLPQTVLVSVAHRTTLDPFHTHALELGSDHPARTQPVEAAL